MGYAKRAFLQVLTMSAVNIISAGLAAGLFWFVVDYMCQQRLPPFLELFLLSYVGVTILTHGYQLVKAIADVHTLWDRARVWRVSYKDAEKWVMDAKFEEQNPDWRYWDEERFRVYVQTERMMGRTKDTAMLIKRSARSA